MSLAIFRAHMQSLACPPDLKRVLPHLEGTSSVAVFGAGLGSLVYALLQLGYTGAVYAVEPDAEAARSLRGKRFPTDRVVLVEQDISALALPEPVDAIWWRGARLIALSPNERRDCLARLHGQLRPGGSLYIDVPAVAAHGRAQYHVANIFLAAYLMSKSVIAEAAAACDLRATFVDYRFLGGAPRVLCTLTR